MEEAMGDLLREDGGFPIDTANVATIGKAFTAGLWVGRRGTEVAGGIGFATVSANGMGLDADGVVIFGNAFTAVMATGEGLLKMYIAVELAFKPVTLL